MLTGGIALPGSFVDSCRTGRVGIEWERGREREDASVLKVLCETDRCCNQSEDMCMCSWVCNVLLFMISISPPGDGPQAILPVANPSGKVHRYAGTASASCACERKNIIGAGAAANNMLRHALLPFVSRPQLYMKQLAGFILLIQRLYTNKHGATRNIHFFTISFERQNKHNPCLCSKKAYWQKQTCGPKFTRLTVARLTWSTVDHRQYGAGSCLFVF